MPYRLVAPDKKLISEADRIVIRKNAPVIAAARLAQVAFVATYDHKDLLSRKQEIHEAFGLTVATPQEILTSL